MRLSYSLNMIYEKRTSVAAPSSSLYPMLSKISCMAVKSFLAQASPSGDRLGKAAAPCGIPINT